MKKDTLITMIATLIFGWTITDFMVEYINIIYIDHSIIQHIIEVFKISWWRVPLMIFCLLIGFVR